MKKYLMEFIFFLTLLLIVFFCDYFLVMKRKLKGKKKKNRNDIMEINYLVGKFKLDRSKILYKPVAMWCSLINAFIISFVTTVISMIKLKMTWQLLIGFVLLFGLIYSIYEIYGRHLVRKGWKKKDE